ncbi:hypothetical protein B0H10DRAFT_2160174 [Mycena sp. CBHHK59/15]|nr:hypothetical protein B0H10DRAFT_2160174 [Mycena sp. CBHHK59/15]
MDSKLEAPLPWHQLLEWLQLQIPLVEPREAPGAGYGLFATAAIPPSTPLFAVPAHALLNVRTLAPHYPTPSALTAVQLISLHLLLYRPLGNSHSLDPLFGPYISILPRKFNSHPLTCHVKGVDVRQLPPSVASALERLSARFRHDWQTVHGYVRDNLSVLSQKKGVRLDRDKDALEVDFLWAWLNVNTRCIYHRLKSSRSDPDNLTLCPILDFANHRVDGPCMKPRPSDADLHNASPIPRLGDAFTLLSPDTPTDCGEEMHLTYGAHPNRTLFVEYGFIVAHKHNRPRGEVDVQDIVEGRFKEKGNEGRAKESILRETGYWGDWTLDGSPSISYRLITALRLFHIPWDRSEDALQRWRDTLTGVRDTISDANERAWKETVSTICSDLIQRAQEHMKLQDDHSTANEGPNRWLLEVVEMLWEEEYHVALEISRNIHEIA